MHNITEVDPSPSYKAPETRRILRVADILVLGDEAEMEQPRTRNEQLTMTQCTTPRRIVSRWFSSLKRRKWSHVPPHTICSTNGPNNSNDRVSEITGGGGCGVDSFKLGVACGLVCVIAAGKSEVNKMVELRTQMELILQNAKQELGRSKLPNEINFTSFSTNFQQPSTSASASASASARDEYSDCCGNEEGRGDECVAGMDELEAELHAELERLQLQLDSEDSFSIPKTPRQHRLDDMGDTGLIHRREEDSASTDYSGELLWGSGVAPLELERKLHQVLEARQEERIKELEDALQCAEQKLQEKEMEVSWWRDTARLVPGHDSELSFSQDTLR